MMKSVELTLCRSGDQVVVHAEGLTIVVKRQDEGLSVYTQDAQDECLKEDWTVFSEADDDDEDGDVSSEPMPDGLIDKVIEARGSHIAGGIISQVIAKHNLTDESWEALPPGRQNELISRLLASDPL